MVTANGKCPLEVKGVFGTGRRRVTDDTARDEQLPSRYRR